MRIGLLALALLTACTAPREDPTPPPPPSASSPPTTLPASFIPDAAPDADAPADALADADAAADADPPAPPPCADGMAHVGRFCIDRWEASLVAEAPDFGVYPWPPNRRPEPSIRYVAQSAAGVLPQAYVSRVEAKAACQNAGKRLCSIAEHQRACMGPSHTRYPYGASFKRNRCNSGKDHLLSLRFGADPKHWKYDDFNDPTLNEEPGFLAKTGAYEGCAGDDGVFDLVGNLHEWVSESVDQDLVDRLAAQAEAEEFERKEQPWKEGNAIFMGGFFSTTDQHGPGCRFTTIAHEPTYHDYSIGFRCCARANVPTSTEPKQKKGSP